MFVSRLQRAAARLTGHGSRLPAHAAHLDPLVLDLDAPEIARDPFACYDVLRAIGPVQWLQRHGAWIVLGHEEVQWAFTRPDLLSNRPYEDVDAVLLAADPPDHTAVRRALTPYFSRPVIEDLGHCAAAHAATRLGGRLDVVTDYARPISEAVAARFLGLTDADVADVRACASASRDFESYTAALDALADRAALYSRLRNDGFDDPRARSLVRLFWIASTATTERVIAECALALVGDAGARDAMTTTPALLAPFIDEVMRLHPPEPMLRRRVTAAFDLGGLRVPPGALVYLSIAAANRDPRRYEAPNELRFDRGARHLTFGHGIHHCIGATLGRATVSAAVRTLLALAPAVRLAQPPGTVRRCATMMAHHIESLSIETGPQGRE